MAFNPGGTDYTGFLRQRAQADEGVTRALKAKGERERAARVKKSGQRSGLAKIGSAVARGAAAYYTGGMSEQMGMGEKIDEITLGTDSEGRAIKNEYGGLVQAGSAVYQGAKAQKQAKLAGADAAFEKQYAKREAGVQRLFDTAKTEEARNQAMAAQRDLEKSSLDYKTRRKDVEEGGFLGTNIGMKDSDYSGLTRGLSPEEMAQKRQELIKPEDQKTETVIAGQKEAERRFVPQEGKSGQGSLPTPDPVSGTAFGVQVDDTAQRKPVSAAMQTETGVGGQYQLQREDNRAKQDELIERITGGGDKAPSDDERKQKQNIANWMRTDLTVQPQQFGDEQFTRALDPTTGTKWGRDYLNRNAIRKGQVG